MPGCEPEWAAYLLQPVLPLYAAVVYDEPLKLNTLRDDLVFYPVPFDKIVAAVCPEAKLRRLIKTRAFPTTV